MEVDGTAVAFQDNEPGDAHDSFQKWRRDNPGGFFINCKTNGSGLVHLVSCHHLGDNRWRFVTGGETLTNLRKVCSRTLSELRNWAKQNGPTKLSNCKDCFPDDSVAEAEQQLANEARALVESGFFDPGDVADARQRVLQAIVRRRGQPAFRSRLLLAYGGKCAVSGCDVEAALEASHIVSYKGPATNHPANGLLLRADLHILFDLGLITVDTATMTVLISPKLKGTSYGEYDGHRLVIPDDPGTRPNLEALNQHREANMPRRELA